MNKCKFQSLRDKCRINADKMVESFEKSCDELLKDPNSAFSRLVNNYEWDVDHEFVSKLGNGEFLPPLNEVPGLTNCDNVSCSICYPKTNCVN